MIVVDAKNKIAGRLATEISKRALNGEEIAVVNSEQAILTNPDAFLERMKIRVKMQTKGNPHKSPKFSRMPERIMKRIIRGMINHKSARGRTAFKKIKTYIGKPADIKGEIIDMPFAEYKGSGKTRTIGEISKELGAKW